MPVPEEVLRSSYFVLVSNNLLYKFSLHYTGMPVNKNAFAIYRINTGIPVNIKRFRKLIALQSLKYQELFC